MKTSVSIVECLMGLKGDAFFGVEHYKPSSKFKSLECTYSNLYYSCNTCNSNKGNFWPSARQLIKNLFIPNPCDHTYDSTS